MFTETTIGVRELVEFLLRSGNLDNRTGQGTTDDMQEGARLHKKIQQAAGGDYTAEVQLRIVYTFKEDAEEDAAQEEDGKEEAALPHVASVTVEGRADGVYHGTLPGKKNRGRKLAIIDEIKTTAGRVDRMREPVPVHLAQAMCYAYMYAGREKLSEIGVRMTYCNRITEQMRYFYKKYSFEELEQWFDDLMGEYLRWAQYLTRWKYRRTASLKALVFPYPYREGQKELAAAVYRTIARERKLFMEAPTGTGKTLSTIFPAMKAMGEGLTDKVFYLTARTTTGTAAVETIALLEQKGMRVKTAVLTAKEKICILEKPACNPDECPRAAGHFDRVNEAIYALLTHEDSFTRETIRAYAEQYAVCPFEMGLDMSLFADVVIGDYNYLFDPHAGLKRFFGDEIKEKQPYVFLVDEAHNLIDRGREMYSAELSQAQLVGFRKKVKDLYPELATLLSSCTGVLAKVGKRLAGKEYLILQDTDSISAAAAEIQDGMEEILAREREEELTRGHGEDPLYPEKHKIRDAFLDFYFAISHFNLIHGKLDDHYISYAEAGERGDVTVTLFCADPGKNLKACMDRGRAAVLFSATFLPIQYYKGILGGTPEDYEIYAHSVFDSKKRGLFIVRDVTSRYAARGREEYTRIAETIHNICGQRNGNYMVFFPSYAFLGEVTGIYEEKYHPVRAEERAPLAGETAILCQRPGMDEKAREAFLGQFETAADDRSLIGMCILGGIFSEGIDLRNDRLIGAVIVGTGIPMVTTQRKVLKTFFDGSSGNGYDYAYRFPGMNKVLQAAGRVIRTEEDIGVVALLDDRFTAPAYRKLFPREWTDCEETTSLQAAARVEEFWNEWL